MITTSARPRRALAGMLVAATALAVMPIVGFAGIAGAADDLPPTAEPIGDGNVCEDVLDEEPFADIDSTSDQYDEIVCLFQSGLTAGKATDPPTYASIGTVTRREMALFLKRVIDLADAREIDDAITALPAYDGDPDYPDIEAQSDAVEEAVGQLSQAGITAGNADGEYGANDTLTRRQMAKFIVRTLEYVTGETLPAPTGDYFDDDPADRSEVEFNQLAELGIFSGDGKGSVDPGGNLSRRQMAAVLTRTLQVLFADGDITGLFNATITEVQAITDAGTADVADAGDVHRFLLSAPADASAVADDASYTVADADGTTADIVCGSAGVTCTLNKSAVKIGETEHAAGTVLTVTVGTFATYTEDGTTAGLQYPLTVSALSEGWTSGGDAVVLAGSDVEIEVDEDADETEAIAPTLTAVAQADASPTTLSLDFSEDVTLAGAAADFTIVADGAACTEAAVTGGTGASAVAGTTADIVVVEFADDVAAGDYELCVAAGAVADLDGNENEALTTPVTLIESTEDEA